MNRSKEIRRKQKPAFFIRESQWFAKGFLQPNTKREIQEASIDAFQTLIWDLPLDDLLPAYGLTPEELSRHAAAGTRGWLATDHVTWVLNELNSMQQDTMLLCPNAVVNVPNEMARKRKHFNFGTIRRLVLPLNVGKRASGETFIGGVNDSGNHWALVIVELRPYKRIIYCDTLAYDPPSILVDVVNNYTSHIPRRGDFTESHLSVAHSPLATSRRGHLCDWRCRNYPLQTCSDICGVIVLINAALAALDRSFFQFLIGPYQKDKLFLQSPTQHSHYLRRVMMAWFAEGRIDIDYVLPKIDSCQSGIPSQFDHTCSFRQDTSIGSKRKLKLSLNRRQSKASSPHPPSTGSSGGHAKINKKQRKCDTDSKSDLQSKSTTLSESSKNSDVKQSKVNTRKKAPKPKKSKASVLSDCTNTYTNADPSSTKGPSTSSSSPSRNPASPDKENKGDSAPTDDSAPDSKDARKFQCEHCGLQLSSRNCLYIFINLTFRMLSYIHFQKYDR